MASKDGDFIEIEIVNWRKYNPREDVKRPSWFRLDNRLLESPDFHSWPGDHIKALIYLFSQASQKNSGTIRVFPEHATRVCMIKERDLRETLQKLVFLGVISIHDTRAVRGRDECDTQKPATGQDRTGQNMTGQDGTPPSGNARARSSGASFASLPAFAPIADVIRDREVSERVQRAWLDAFPDAPWIIAEVRKALAWEASNGREKKRFGAFMTRWMTNGWDSRRGPTASRNYAADRESQNRAALNEYLDSIGEKK